MATTGDDFHMATDSDDGPAKGFGPAGRATEGGGTGGSGPRDPRGWGGVLFQRQVHGWDWPRKMPTFISSPHRYGIECCTLRAAAAPRLNFGSLGVLP